MNRSLLGRVGSFLFVFYALGFGVFFAAALLRFSSQTVLPDLRWMYALDGAITLFLRYLLPIHAAAIAVAASLSTARPAAPGAPAEPFSRIVSSTLVVFLLLSAAYTLAYEIGYPAALRNLQDMRTSSALARQLKTQARAAQQNGSFRQGLDLIERYLDIDRNDREAREMRVALQSQAAFKEAPAAARSVALEAQGTAGIGAQALVDKARSAFDRQDWFAAHYYAQKANSLDPRRTDALRLASEAAQKLASPTGLDRQGTEAFKEKKDAYFKLVGGNYLDAYYSFMSLSAKYPKDSDIAAYLAEAGKKVAEESFFLDEARRVESMPGTRQILFFNSTTAEALEAVAIGRMVQVREGTYFLDIEAVRYSPSGRVIWHFSAPYGKVENNTVLLHCIDRNDPRLQFLPLYIQGMRPAEDRSMLRLNVSVDSLASLSTSPQALAELGPVDLWRMRQSFPGLGFSRATLMVELMMKLVMPFAFLILSLLALAFGWAFRARGSSSGRPAGLAVVLTPLVPFVLAVLSLLYLYANRVVLGFTALAFGFTAAFIVGAALQLVLLVTALVLLAGQSSS